MLYQRNSFAFKNESDKENQKSDKRNIKDDKQSQKISFLKNCIS